MAARVEAPFPEIVELTSLTMAELAPLMEEEISEWRRYFAWDFRPSAELLRRFLNLRSLFGYALRAGRTVVGYSYHVCEGRKGLIGDFYLRRDYADPSNEMMLLGAAVQGLMLVPGLQRIESQLLLLNAPPTQTLPFSRFLSRYERFFMEISACGRAGDKGAYTIAGGDVHALERRLPRGDRASDGEFVPRACGQRYQRSVPHDSRRAAFLNQHYSVSRLWAFFDESLGGGRRPNKWKCLRCESGEHGVREIGACDAIMCVAGGARWRTGL